MKTWRPVAIAVLSSLLLAMPALAARTTTATVTIDYIVAADGTCYLTQTASWDGYRVNRVRHVWYETGKSGPYDYFFFSTSGYPNGESHSTGTFTSTETRPVYSGESYYAHALFRSNGGAILAEASSSDLVLPSSCGTRPTTP